MKQYVVYWLPPVAWMVTIFVLSAQPDLPQPPGPWLENVVDKAAHALAYGVLAGLLLRAMRQRRPVSLPLLMVCAALATAYGVTDEYHQMFVPGRTASLADLAADALGAGVTMVLAAWLERRRVRARGLSEAQR